MTVVYPLTLYYDAACPLCAREMQALAAYAGAQRLRLIDCSSPAFSDPETRAANLSRAELMRLIHARDGAGQWYRGIDVFVLAYDAVDIRAVARLWAHPRWRPLWERVYPWVAQHRMGLSRLGLGRPFGWWVGWAARRAQVRAAGCRDGACAVAEATPPAPDQFDQTC